MRVQGSPTIKRLSIITAMLLLYVQSASADRYYPVDYGRITSVRGWRVDPFGSGQRRFHRGWDITCPSGTPVYPTQMGLVLFAGQHKGYGKLVAIDRTKPAQATGFQPA